MKCLGVLVMRFGDKYLRYVVFGAILVLVAACAPRGTLKYGLGHPDADIQTMYVVTQHPIGKASALFGEDRNFTLNHFRADVSVPPIHELGQIEWPKKEPDAAKHFVVTGSQVLRDGAQMGAHLARERSGKQTLIYVHGYNNTLSEAMYRFAQITADFNVKGPSVLFAWQSAGDARGYIYDRDSVLFARDDLVATLKALTTRPGEKVLLLGHSMGAQLTMEALRQIAISGDRAVLNKLSGVVLISPDIDPDLFRDQATTIGKLPVPIVIFISHEDRALSLASFITGQKERLGVITSPKQVGGLDVRVVDFSALNDGKGLNHLTALTSPAAIGVLRDMIATGQVAGDAGDRYVVLAGVPIAE